MPNHRILLVLGTLVFWCLLQLPMHAAPPDSDKPAAPTGSNYMKVPFTKIKDFEDFRMKYPFLQDLIVSVESANQVEIQREVNQAEIANGKEPSHVSKLYAYEFNQKSSRVLIVALEGMACGTGRGCPLAIFIDKGGKYKTDVDLSPDDATALYITADKSALLYCQVKGRQGYPTELRFANASYNHPRPYTKSQPNPCAGCAGDGCWDSRSRRFRNR